MNYMAKNLNWLMKLVNIIKMRSTKKKKKIYRVFFLNLNQNLCKNILTIQKLIVTTNNWDLKGDKYVSLGHKGLYGK